MKHKIPFTNWYLWKKVTKEEGRKKRIANPLNCNNCGVSYASKNDTSGKKTCVSCRATAKKHYNKKKNAQMLR